MKASKSRDRASRATVDFVSRKKQNPPPELETIPAVDEREFTDVITKMVNTSPVTREDVEKRGIRRKKNPETDPVKLAMVFPEAPPMKLSAEEWRQVRMTDELNREYRKKKKN
jgi:hypothetical protein